MTLIMAVPSTASAYRDSGGYFTKGSHSADGKEMIMGTLNKCVYSLNPTNAGVNWRVNTGAKVIGPPTVAPDGSIYLATQSSWLAKLTSTGDWAWKCKSAKGNQSQPTVVGGRVYMTSLDGNLYAFDTDIDPSKTYQPCSKKKFGVTAPLNWKIPVGVAGSKKGGASRFKPISLSGQRLVVGALGGGTNEGVHLIKDLGDSAEVLDSYLFTGDEGARIGGIANGDVVIFTSRHRMIALDTTGDAFTELWEKPVQGDGFHRVRPSFSPDKKTIYIGDRDAHTLYAVDAATGHVIFDLYTGHAIVSEITVHPVDGTLYFGHAGSGQHFFAVDPSGVPATFQDAKSLAFDGNDGKKKARHTWRSTPFLNLHEGTIAAGHNTGSLFFLNVDDFSIAAKFDANSKEERVECRDAPDITAWHAPEIHPLP